MSNYLYDKFFGKYRILVPIDEKTNDFPRNSKGEIETDDFYIPCRKYGKKSGQIYHYGHNILGVVVYGLIKYRKLIKLCEDEGIHLIDVKEGDDECVILFGANDFELIADYMGASTQGKNIRPFSIKNLPKSDYEIPPADYQKYKSISYQIDIKDKLAIANLTDEFLIKTFGKSVGQDVKKHKMSRQKKEYVHMKGKWNEYIEYLENGLGDINVN